MYRILDKHNNFGTIWRAATPNFSVELQLTQSHEPYDGSDDDGSIAAALASGDMVMFNSTVTVFCGEAEIGYDHLGNSVYNSGDVAQFIHDGYFRDMLRTACANARQYLAAMPHLRAA